MNLNLNWNLEHITDAEKLCWTEREDGKYQLKEETEQLINCTAFVGINKLTPKNCKEFIRRIYILAIAGFPMPDTFTPSFIESHIGLSTSAPEWDYRKFKNSVFSALEEAASERINSYSKQDTT